VYLRRERLIGSRLGFSVKYKGLLAGGRPASSIWKYNTLTDGLTAGDWEEVQRFIDFLELPTELTKRLEGLNSQSGAGSLWQTLTCLQT
jgi:hypothetical protein